MDRYELFDRKARRLTYAMLGIAIFISALNLLPWEWGRQWFMLAALCTQLGLFWHLTRVVAKRSAAAQEESEQ